MAASVRLTCRGAGDLPGIASFSRREWRKNSNLQGLFFGSWRRGASCQFVLTWAIDGDLRLGVKLVLNTPYFGEKHRYF